VRISLATCVGVSALVLVACAGAGCSKTDVRNETVATANGEDIKVLELREFLGLRGGATAASEIVTQVKKEALDRLISGRLLAQDARSKGLDKADEFLRLVKQNEQGVLITALLRKEMSSKLKVSGDDIEAEAKRMQAADNTLSGEMAKTQAGRTVSERHMRKVEEDLIAAARKEFPATIDGEMVGRIGKGEKLSEDTVLATAGEDEVRYGDVKKILQNMSSGMHGGQDFSANPEAIQRVLDREVTGRALSAYARKQGIEGSEWMESVQQDMERSILIDLLARQELAEGAVVTDDEIAKAYKEHAEMFVRNGKKITLSQVKDQLRRFLQNEKRRKTIEMHIEELKKKAKITVNEELLNKV
jgi:hypothetical protein